MKKIVFLSVFLLSLFIFANFSFAQEPTPTPIPKIDYQLPYPGILPDNPLYFLKAIRDRLIIFVVADPLKMADFSLLAADKRLNSGAYLIKKGKDKYQLAESTISKGENYFEKAFEKTKEAKRQGMDTADISRRLFNASRKHQEVIKDLTKNVDSKTKESLNLILKRVVDFEKQAKVLITK